jgi:hypothetical protein
MNRHERRAAAKRPSPPEPSDMASAPNTINAAARPTGDPRAKPSLLLRLFSRILLADWILSRVQNPQVEQLLITLAMESGRPEAADRIMRRQALRRLTAP